ncbi:MAG: serine/threonine protein kinase [Sandaracinaceae bacterium]
MGDPNPTRPSFPPERPEAICPTCGETFWEPGKTICPWDDTPLDRDGGNTVVDRVVGGKYRRLTLIGEGGMGRVYLGEHTLSLERVALKVMRPELLQDPQQRARFLRECRTIEDLSAPHVIKVMEAGVSALGELYLVTELLEGENLGDRLARGDAIPVALTVSMMRRVAEALGAVHDKGVVHRDLKPENVFLCNDGSLRVLDFGVARLLDGSEVVGGSRKLTALGTVVGTPAYMSPEGATGRPVGPAADLYSLGVMMYELLSGDLPFWDEVPLKMMGLHLKATPPPLGELRPELPPSLVALTHLLLEKRATDRPTSAGEVVTALSALEGQLGSPEVAKVGGSLPPRPSESLPAPTANLPSVAPPLGEETPLSTDVTPFAQLQDGTPTVNQAFPDAAPGFTQPASVLAPNPPSPGPPAASPQTRESPLEALLEPPGRAQDTAPKQYERTQPFPLSNSDPVRPPASKPVRPPGTPTWKFALIALVLFFVTLAASAGITLLWVNL